MRHIRYSSKATEALRSLQEDGSVLDLTLDVPTRWNSTYDMLVRLCKLQTCIHRVLRNPDAVKPATADRLRLLDEQRFMIRNLVANLKHFKVMFSLLVEIKS